VTLTAPMFLAALGLLLPVLLAFLVKQQRHVLRVPSTMVWRLRAKSVSRSRKIRDLRRLVALVLCLLGVAALVLAAARPSGKKSELHVYVVDVSASMADGPLEAARRWLDRDIATLGPNARVALVLAGAEARVVLSPTPPGPRVDQALAALKPEPRSAAYEESFALADALTSANGGTVTVLSDHALEGEGLVHRPALRIFPRTGATDNLGITSLYTRPVPDAPDEGDREAVVVIATSSPASRRARLRVTLGGRPVADRHLLLAEHGETTERVTIRGAGRLVARVSSDDRKADALAIDDEASLDELTRKAPRVALIHRTGKDVGVGGFFVEKALRAAGVSEIVDLDANVSLPSDLSSRVDVTVTLADGDVPKNVPIFAIGATPPVLGLQPRQVFQDHAHLRSLATEESLLRGVALDGVTTLRGQVADPPAGSRTLIDLDGGPTLLAGGKGKDAWVWLGIEPEASDLVLRVAFPVLVGNVLAELGGATQVVTARTVPRAEAGLVESTPRAPLPTPGEPRWRVPARPAMLLALLGALLLGFEAWFSLRRRGGVNAKDAVIA